MIGHPSSSNPFTALNMGVFTAQLVCALAADGGGYGDFGAEYDPSVLINTNDNGFIVVEIQYRLGAFGFLASEDLNAHGQLNAGLLDQRFALEWVNKYISQFGGDPSRVTIGGESYGAGSVMFHLLARGGQTSGLFNNPSNPHVQRFCAYSYASGNVSESRGYFGSLAFLPVIDGKYIRERPSEQLSRGKVSGERILVGNNANDGVPLTNSNVETRAAYDAFVTSSFPLFTQADIAQLNAVYRIDGCRVVSRLRRL
ncbi:Alpha/Beta hydrolase protein [Coniella lustricola]|uniref:Alpha/Beta hydrolase protein n=1 Tax=Coniella lustricola TaxID=2025994 RepID=A0A2T3A2S7_9PEZI|nr:Alpha/Beta hydrolase protein [Coniella lustricola]